MSELVCKHGYGAFACPHCPAAVRRGRGDAIPLMVEEDRQRRELDAALSVLRDLVAMEDTPLDKLRVGRVNDAWARARALVAEHTTNEETP